VARCVQVVRRLLIKSRDIGLFCNLSSATLTDPGFPQLLEFLEANRAIGPSLVFEFTQSAVRAMGPPEHESLAVLADRGFRFSMDNVVDLDLEGRELRGRGFRFVKVPAALLLGRDGHPKPETDPAELSGMLGGFGVDLIAERIESENIATDVSEYNVRFGQGNLFAPPRPVRAEALQGGIDEEVRPAKAGTNGQVRSGRGSGEQPKSSADLLAAAANDSLSAPGGQAARR